MAKHVNDPHEPGRLAGCPDCENACNCNVAGQSAAECVHLGYHCGMRVQIPAHTDAWMSGDRYGVVVRSVKRASDGEYVVHVRMDVSGKTRRFIAPDLEHVG
jgi:hypothetical protein